MSKHIYLTIVHDRHQDDVFKGFADKEDAKTHLRKVQDSLGWDDAQEVLDMYGWWCLYISDDYYLAVEEIEFVE